MPKPSTSVERVTSMLEDDAFRRGGTVTYDSLLAIAEKFVLSPSQVVEVRNRLRDAEVEIEGEGDDPSSSPTGEELPEREPSSEQLASIVRQYFNEAARFGLLSRQEEAALFRRIRAGEQAKHALGENPSSDTVAALVETSKDGELARRQVLNANLRLVPWVAKKYRRNGHLAFEDLIQEGNLGLMKGVDKFDHTMGTKFSTYATWWIVQAITRARANTNRLVRLPVHFQQRMSKLRRARRALERENGGIPPSVAELAQHLGWPSGQIQFLLDSETSPVSLDSRPNELQRDTLGESIPASMAGPDEIVFDHERRRRVESALADLKPREREVLKRRFENEETLEAIGNDFDVTRERIRQIESKALKILRHPARRKVLEELTDPPARDLEEEPEE